MSISSHPPSYERPIEPKQLTPPVIGIGALFHNVKFSSTLADFVEYAYKKGCHLLIPNHRSFLTIFQKLYFLFPFLNFLKPIYLYPSNSEKWGNYLTRTPSICFSKFYIVCLSHFWFKFLKQMNKFMASNNFSQAIECTTSMHMNELCFLMIIDQIFWSHPKTFELAKSCILCSDLWFVS